MCVGVLNRIFGIERKGTAPQPATRSGKALVVANWKCHKTSDEACRWLDDLGKRVEGERSAKRAELVSGNQGR